MEKYIISENKNDYMNIMRVWYTDILSLLFYMYSLSKIFLYML